MHSTNTEDELERIKRERTLGGFGVRVVQIYTYHILERWEEDVNINWIVLWKIYIYINLSRIVIWQEK